MYTEDGMIIGSFSHSGETIHVSAAEIRDVLIRFLDLYGTRHLLGPDFIRVIGEGSGAIRYRNLAAACGFADDDAAFCESLIRILQSRSGLSPEPVRINGIALPQLLLMPVLEKLLPGSRFISVKDVPQLGALVNAAIPDDQENDLLEVIRKYPVRLSMHTIRQMRLSRDVAYQYLPFVEELDGVGHTNTWIGQFHQGLLEQMYQNRVIFLLNMSCPVYCRFCFRKHKESRNQENPTPADVKKAVEHVRQSPSIKEIVITGGDPFLSRENMACAIDGLMEIPHVQTLRLATRSVAYYPHLFLANDAELIRYLKLKNLALQQRGKRMEVATHFIHPDEVSPESLDIITDLVNSGIAVYIQTPFLNDCNDQGPELVRLYQLLRAAGAELHYIYIPCSPIHGNSIYWSPLSKGIDVGNHLRAHLSDRVIPRICTATPIGKMDWHTSGWAVAPDSENDRFLWIRSPYNPAYFKRFAPIANELDVVRLNEEGTIDVRYMAEIGDPSLYWGSRKPSLEKQPTTDADALNRFRESALADQRMGGSIVATGSPTLHRVHETRVEIDPSGTADDLTYIRRHEAITDVVVAGKEDAVDRLADVARIVEALHTIPHVTAVRLRSCKLAHRPETCTRSVIRRLGDLNRLTVADPQRLEIETWFLHPDDVRPAHRNIVRDLGNRGVTVYANTPLLTDINDSPAEINLLAYKLRETGIEFHHLYVAGLPIQEEWNQKRPVTVENVIDIATKVRREGSGREIPRYIIRTALGEADFGLTTRFLNIGDSLNVKLLPYSLAYFQGMNPDFAWPADVQVDLTGRPIVALAGLVSESGFMVSRS